MSRPTEESWERGAACGPGSPAAASTFATSAHAGRPLRVVAAEGEPYHRYALLFVE